VEFREWDPAGELTRHRPEDTGPAACAARRRSR
jgi:hypothetical protein